MNTGIKPAIVQGKKSFPQSKREKSSKVSASKVSKLQKKLNTPVFSGITQLPKDRKLQGVVDADILAYVKTHAGNDLKKVAVRFSAYADAKKEQPFPFEKERTLYDEKGNKKTGKRASVVWQMINAGKDTAEPLTLEEVDKAHKAIKARRFHALIDALNGGQSPSAKDSWGKNYVELYVL